MFSLPLQVAYFVATLVLFSVVAFFTRPPGRRLIGALCSVAAFTAASAPIDAVGLRTGLWSYPSCVDPPHPPILVYLGQALVFVGCIALIGWRVQRRWGRRGTLVLIALVCTLGLARDLFVATIFPNIIRFGPAPQAELADVVAWGVVLLFALGLTRIVVGPTVLAPE